MNIGSIQTTGIFSQPLKIKGQEPETPAKKVTIKQITAAAIGAVAGGALTYYTKAPANMYISGALGLIGGFGTTSEAINYFRGEVKEPEYNGSQCQDWGRTIEYEAEVGFRGMLSLIGGLGLGYVGTALGDAGRIVAGAISGAAIGFSAYKNK